MARTTKKETAFPGVDLTVPIDREKIKPDAEGEGCFGREWDMGSPECPLCAMNDLCGILYQDVVNAKVKALSDPKKPFLDETDFSQVDEAALMNICRNRAGEITTNELLQKVMEQARTMDDIAALEFLKKFKEKNGLKFRNNVVWLS